MRGEWQRCDPEVSLRKAVNNGWYWIANAIGCQWWQNDFHPISSKENVQVLNTAGVKQERWLKPTRRCGHYDGPKWSTLSNSILDSDSLWNIVDAKKCKRHRRGWNRRINSNRCRDSCEWSIQNEGGHSSENREVFVHRPSRTLLIHSFRSTESIIYITQSLIQEVEFKIDIQNRKTIWKSPTV